MGTTTAPDTAAAATGAGRATEGVREPGPAGRPKRADARRNYERLLAEARAVFAEHGTDASLEEIARRSGVGIGTLYRHFPNRHAMMSAVFQDAVGVLLDRSRTLADAPDAREALAEWLRTLITHSGEYRGLAGALMSASHDTDSALSASCSLLTDAGARLLERAVAAGQVREDASIADLMQLTNAISLAADQSPADPALPDRLLTLTLRGLTR
ncbi:helix-turn-helix domain-containing protein [Streptomyces sp. NPDC006798]|uniref:TetR/AcrR family transcriptional regulator n=1 Tax=Streptomyces sp. NPDC006798 TaxID=3155462 RepID=UPI0033D53746